MTLHARSGRTAPAPAQFRIPILLAAAAAALTAVPSAVGQGMGGYQTIDEAGSVIVDDGFVPQPSGHGAFADTCYGDQCHGCQQCQIHPPRGPGLINRMLGEACPRWTAQVDALMLWQSNIPNVPLLVVENPLDPANPTPFLGTNQLLPDMAIGPRAALLLHIDQESAIENNYFYVGSISATRDFAAPPGQKLGWGSLANLSTFGSIDAGTVTTNNEIQSYELNWRHRHCGSPFTWLIGFRWVEWNESLVLQDSYSSQFTFGDDLLSVDTNNDLYGAQLGFDAVLLTLWDAIRFNALAKAGVYGNAASATTIVQSDRALNNNFTGTGSQTSFFGEIGVNGTVRISDHLFWRAGYNFFWLSGVATASQQLAAVDATTTPAEGVVTAASSVFLNGVNTGIEVIW